MEYNWQAVCRLQSIIQFAAYDTKWFTRPEIREYRCRARPLAQIRDFDSGDDVQFVRENTLKMVRTSSIRADIMKFIKIIKAPQILN